MTDSSSANLLVLISDEHRKDAMGCAGHPLVKTPNLDALAERGTLFANAYTPSPMCVPARAGIACGDYVHKIGHWDSATPYYGNTRSWMRQLRDQGIEVSSIGKLHFRSTEDDNGFTEEILPMHVVGGVGWAIGLLRENPPEYYNLYDPETIDLPVAYDLDKRPNHPELRNIAKFYDYDRYFDEQKVREAKVAYYGLTSFMDNCIGRILQALESSGQVENTVVVYVSDHGDMLGDHGLWTKQVMYEASAGVPMIAAGPGVPNGLCKDLHIAIGYCRYGA